MFVCTCTLQTTFYIYIYIYCIWLYTVHVYIYIYIRYTLWQYLLNSYGTSWNPPWLIAGKNRSWIYPTKLMVQRWYQRCNPLKYSKGHTTQSVRHPIYVFRGPCSHFCFFANGFRSGLMISIPEWILYFWLWRCPGSLRKAESLPWRDCPWRKKPKLVLNTLDFWWFYI